MGYMANKATRRMVAYKVCNDIRSKRKTCNTIINEIAECGMMCSRSELEALRSILNRRVHEYNSTPSLTMPELIDNIKDDIVYFWGKF